MSDNGASDETTKPDNERPEPPWVELCEHLIELKREIVFVRSELAEVRGQVSLIRSVSENKANEVIELNARQIELREIVERNKIDTDAQWMEVKTRLNDGDEQFTSIMARFDKLAGELCPTIPPGAGSE